MTKKQPNPEKEDKAPKDLDEKFDSNLHIRSIFDHPNVGITGFIDCEYPIGVKALLEEFAEEVRGCKFMVQHVFYRNGALDFIFVDADQNHELQLWRAVDILKRKSTSICMGCGANADREIHHNKMITICKDCFRKQANLGQTGTWLDKY